MSDQFPSSGYPGFTPQQQQASLSSSSIPQEQQLKVGSTSTETAPGLDSLMKQSFALPAEMQQWVPAEQQKEPQAVTNQRSLGQSQTQPPNTHLKAPALLPGTSITSTVPPVVAPLASQTPVSQVAKTPGPGRAIRGRGYRGSIRGSRRRKSSGTPLKDSDGESDEEFTMEGVKTKSGRKVHRPAHFDPAVKTPSRRRGPYRRFHDSRICKICQRGHSPQSNMIVFCDGCNSPYHQLCHDPPIDDLVIAVAETEWFCHVCATKRAEKPLRTGLSGQGLTEDDKRTYLTSLPLSSLVELIFFCEKQHPETPLYDPEIKSIVANIRRTNVAALTTTNLAATTNTASTLSSTTTNEDTAMKDGTPASGGTGSIIAPSDDTTLPLTYEDMIITALAAIGDTAGSPPKVIWEWLGRNYPTLSGHDIRSEAQGSLQKALKHGTILRDGSIYRINPVDAKVQSLLGSISSQSTSDPSILLPGSGIKLPPETEDDTFLVDRLLEADKSVDMKEKGFSHRFVGVVVRNGTVDVGVNGDTLYAVAPAVKINGSSGSGTNGITGSMIDQDGEEDEDEDAEGVEDVMVM